MGFYERVVFSRLMEYGLDRPTVHRERSRVLAPARGDILEIGLGTGLNLLNYPAGVTRVHSLGPEPTPDPRALARARTAGIDIAHRTGTAEAMPYADASFDTAVVTFVLCTIPDPDASLRELARILRPDGALLFLEHVVERPGLTRTAQRLVEPLTRRINCGCSLLRDTQPVIERYFEVTALDDRYEPGAPPLYRRIISGAARPR